MRWSSRPSARFITRETRSGPTSTTTARRAALISLALLSCAGQSTVAPAGADAQTTATLSADFTPLTLGGRTTLDFGFAFSAPVREVPPPLTEVQLRYPNNLGIGLSGLGLATCTAPPLEADGPSGCPPNSVMGYGVAYTGIVLGTTPVAENAPITIFRAPDQEGRLTLLFYAEGTEPVETRIVFPGLLLPARSPFGGLVSIGIPLVPTLPGAPYISVIHLRATIGPERVTYYERVGGFTFAFKPRGILLPPGCPRGGFPFAARFGFADGSFANAGTKVACPDPKRKPKHKQRHRR